MRPAAAASQRDPDSGSSCRHLRHHAVRSLGRELELALQSARCESDESHENGGAGPFAGTVDAGVSSHACAGGAGLSGALRVRYRMGVFRRVAVWCCARRADVFLFHAIGVESRGRSPRADYRRAQQRRRAHRKLMPRNADCRFCKIASHATYIVFEDEMSIAFLDYKPLFIGHTVLIPKAHYATLA